MSDVQKCDACGDIRFSHPSSYELSHQVADIEANPNAVDITADGDLCNSCALKVAKLIKRISNGDA